MIAKLKVFKYSFFGSWQVNVEFIIVEISWRGSFLVVILIVIDKRIWSYSFFERVNMRVVAIEGRKSHIRIEKMTLMLRRFVFTD